MEAGNRGRGGFNKCNANIPERIENVVESNKTENAVCITLLSAISQ